MTLKKIFESIGKFGIFDIPENEKANSDNWFKLKIRDIFKFLLLDDARKIV